MNRLAVSARLPRSILALAFGCVLTGCIVKVERRPGEASSEGGGAGKIAGNINIEGSSTVYPISEAVVVEFEKLQPDVKVTVGSSGTGGGFKKWINGEIDIVDASRPIVEKEKEQCDAKKIEVVEMQIAIDGISVVVNPANDWADCMTIAELKKIWEPGSTVKNWKDVRPEWPDEPIQLFGADTESGTFDYFTEVVVGKAKSSRSDYTANSNDNVLVQGVGDNKYALGYFGFAYYAENTGKLKPVAISDGKEAECVLPTPETIESGTYRPLSRPLFLYTSKAALKRPEVAEFLKFYLSAKGQEMVTARKYVRLNPAKLGEMNERLEAALK